MTIGATASLSSGYHPQSKGQAECTNQTLENTLRCTIASRPVEHRTWLPMVEYAHWCQWPLECHPSWHPWASNNHTFTARRGSLLFSLCGPTFGAVGVFGNRCMQPAVRDLYLVVCEISALRPGMLWGCFPFPFPHSLLDCFC